MTFNWIEMVLLLFMGAAVGALSALVGLGGGILMIPLLPMVVPMLPSEAAATSLFTILLVAIVNAWKFTNQRAINWNQALWFGGSAGLVSLAAASVAARAPERMVRAAFGLMLLFLILFVMLERRNRDISHEDRRRGRLAWVSLGAFCGLLSGGTGLGGGLVAGPLLLRLRMAAAEKVIPLVNVMMIFSAGLGVVGYAINRPERRGWHWGALWIDAAVFLFVGAQITSPVGIKYQAYIPAVTRRRILIALMILLSCRVWWEVLVYGNDSL